MAKLRGVELIDVRDGEVKKISYDGSAYVKMYDSPKMGDIVRSPGVWDAEESAFYKVITRDGFGDNAIIDDVGDKRSGLSTFDVFRKAVGAEESGLDERVTDLEKRVDRIEESTKPKTVKRRAKGEEKVLVVDETYANSDYQKGDVSTVEKTDSAGVCVEEHGVGLFHSEYEVIVKESEDAEFIEGEFAKVVGGTLCGTINPGVLVEIMNKKDCQGYYKIKLIDGSDYGFAKPEALEKVELSEEDIKLIKLGRKPGVYKGGDIIKVTETFGVVKIDIGDLVEVKKRGPSKDTFYMKGSPSYILAGKLVAPVESRVDIEWRECV